MAIFHFSIYARSRGRGRSAVSMSAYRTGTDIFDERRGRWARYKMKASEVVDTFILLPLGAPQWSRNKLWNSAEAKEKRVNACVSREIIVALPQELEAAAHRAILSKFVAPLVKTHQLAVEVSTHDSRRRKRGPKRTPNIHAHIQLSTRRLGRNGFGQKSRELDARTDGRRIVRVWRWRWSRCVNSALAEHGLPVRISHKSNEARKLLQLPTIKEGVGSGAASRRMHNVQTRDLNRRISEALKTPLVETRAEPGPGTNAKHRNPLAERFATHEPDHQSVQECRPDVWEADDIDDDAQVFSYRER
jgi:hypothetical protein